MPSSWVCCAPLLALNALFRLNRLSKKRRPQTPLHKPPMAEELRFPCWLVSPQQVTLKLYLRHQLISQNSVSTSHRLAMRTLRNVSTQTFYGIHHQACC